MPKYKSNLEEYKKIIAREYISKLYHFTDRENLESIIKNGGLYSWSYCEKNNIKIPVLASGDLSHSLDRKAGLENYVRLSLCNNHPMKYVAMNEGRINNPVLLEIDPELIYWQETMFSDMNATKNGARIGSDIDDFDAIRFDITRLNNYFDLSDEDKSYYQAEILVYEHIPLEYILNIKDFGISVPNSKAITSHRNAYTAQVTRDTPTAFIFLLDQSISMRSQTQLYGEDISMSEALARIVNRSIEELVNRCVKGSDIRHYFDIAVIGYGVGAESAWLGNLEGKDFVSPNELRYNPYKMVSIKEEKRTRRGVELKEVERAQWIEAKATYNQTRLHDAMRYAQNLLADWTQKHKGKICYPPTIINITDGEYNCISDEEIMQIANELKSIETLDGNVLFFNIHISASNTNAVFFPSDKSVLSSTALKLYELSSLLPERYNDSISKLLGADSDSSKRKRGLVVNADMSTLIKILEIGTPTNIPNNI